MEREQALLDRIRSFNRFYTNLIGLLDQHFLDSPFSLTEARVLYEIRHIENCSAKMIRENISIDEGYLSRIIKRFAKQGLLKKAPSSEDKRLHIIVLTEKGHGAFSRLNENSNRSIFRLISGLSGSERDRLVQMMDGIRGLLESNDLERN